MSSVQALKGIGFHENAETVLIYIIINFLLPDIVSEWDWSQTASRKFPESILKAPTIFCFCQKPIKPCSNAFTGFQFFRYSEIFHIANIVSLIVIDFETLLRILKVLFSGRSNNFISNAKVKFSATRKEPTLYLSSAVSRNGPSIINCKFFSFVFASFNSASSDFIA